MIFLFVGQLQWYIGGVLCFNRSLLFGWHLVVPIHTSNFA